MISPYPIILPQGKEQTLLQVVFVRVRMNKVTR